MYSINHLFETKIPLNETYVNQKLGHLMDERFTSQCKNLGTLKEVLHDMYLYSTKLYMYTKETLDSFLDTDYTLEEHIRIHNNFNYILNTLDGYRAQYKDRCSNLDG